MALFDHLFSGGEETIIKRMVEITSIAKRSNAEVTKMIKGRRRSVEQIKRLEKESDAKVFELSNMASSGAVSPNVIDDVLSLIDYEDGIVDASFNLARELMRYSIPDSKVRRIVKSRLLTMARLAGSAISELENMLSSDDQREIKRSRIKIEDLEQEGDEIKDYLLDFAYKGRIDFKAFYNISELAHKSDNVLDSCEDAADLYLSVMNAIVT